MSEPRANFYPASISSGVTNMSYVGGPTYVGPNGINLLFPFTVANNVLDINPINNFNVNSGTNPDNQGSTVRLSGSFTNVSDIGVNFKIYIKNCTWNGRTIPNVSSISVYKPANVTQVQQLDETFVGHMDSTSYTVTGGPPPSNFALQFPRYGITYAFLTPLVVKATDQSGHVFYITFVSSWDK